MKGATTRGREVCVKIDHLAISPSQFYSCPIKFIFCLKCYLVIHIQVEWFIKKNLFLVDLPKSFRLRGKYLLHFFNDQIEVVFEKLNA